MFLRKMPDNVLMHFLRFLGAVSISIAVYSLLALGWGATGFSAYRQLNTEKKHLEKNLDGLMRTNNYLEKTRDSLRQDPEALVLNARKLGYGKPGEKYVRIEGLGTPQNPHTEAGSVLYAATPESVPDLTIKCIAIFAGLSFLILSFAFDDRRSRDGERNPLRNSG